MDLACFAYRWTRQGPQMADEIPVDSCGDCLTAAAVKIRALPRLYAELGVLLREGTARPRVDDRVSGGEIDPPAPIDLRAEELQASIHWTLTAWEPVVREAARLGPERTRGVRREWAVATASRAIAHHVKTLASIDVMEGFFTGPDVVMEADGRQAVAMLLEVHRRASLLLGLDEDLVDLGGTCASCGDWGTVSHRAGHQRTRCRGCGATSTVDDHRRALASSVSASLRR